MFIKIASRIILTALLISMLTMALNIQPVRAIETITIRPDGSVDPPTAPISNDGNVYYTFTADIIDYQIVVERSNIIIDGADHTLEGTWTDDIGFSLSGVTAVTIKHVNIQYYMVAIKLYASTYNNISENYLYLNTAGIELTESSHNVISGNDIRRTEFGSAICLHHQSDNNTISGNHVLHNGYDGIAIGDHCSLNRVSDNNITESYEAGIGVYGGDWNTICRNIITAGAYTGIMLTDESNYNTISKNNITENRDGIKLLTYYGPTTCHNNIISGNNITENEITGILFGEAEHYGKANNNTVSGNKIVSNGRGIYFYCSYNNTIVGNDIATNNWEGIFLSSFGWLPGQSNYIYHNNLIDNAEQVAWDDNPIPIYSWDNGYPSGGNYWSDQDHGYCADHFSGPNQDIPSDTGDGIVDTPYVIVEANQDNYPLMRPARAHLKQLAITRGLTWLTAQQNGESGAWNDFLFPPPNPLLGDYFPVASTAFAVITLCEYARRPPPLGLDMDPFDDTYLYKNYIVKGLEYIFRHAYSADINEEPAGDPDVNLVNDKGIYFLSPDEDRTLWRPVYETSIVMMALEATAHPEFIVDSELNPAIGGWTYLDLMKDAVDYLSWAQNDVPNSGRGGWDSGAYDDGTNVGPWIHTIDPTPGSYDSSTHFISRWVALGLMSAEAWDVNAPDWVKTELLNVWLFFSQDFPSPPGTGGFGEPDYVPTITVTAAGLIELTYCGVQTTDPRWTAARYFIGSDPGWDIPYDWIEGVGHIGDFCGMYVVMKAAMTADEDPVASGIQPVTTFGSHDWQEKYDECLIESQYEVGCWFTGEYFDMTGVLVTEWNLLILLKFAPEPVETATGTGTATFATDAGTIEDLEAVDEASLPTEGKPPLEFPHGFFSFRVTGLTPGQTVTITGTFPSDMPVGTQYWTCHDGTWVQIPVGDDDGDNVITFMVTDGGLGDGDKTANGEIDEPGAPGTRAPVIYATVDIAPDALNLRSKGQWITAYIELPEGYDVNDIDVSTVMLNDTIPVSLLDVPAPHPVPTEIGDYDEDGIPDLMVKFDRALVHSFIYSSGITHGEVSLTITGELLDGTGFEGTDVVSVKYGSGPGYQSARMH